MKKLNLSGNHLPLPDASSSPQQIHSATNSDAQPPFIKLLDNQDMMQLFNISPRTLQNWRSKGIIGFARIKGKIYYQQSDVDEMLKKNRVR